MTRTEMKQTGGGNAPRENKQQFTREDYIEGRCTHRQFYTQFVTPEIRERVLARFGIERLKASTDAHLNDIPLSQWDALTYGIKAGTDNSLSAGVCIMKEDYRDMVAHFQNDRPGKPLVGVISYYGGKGGAQ